jgi:hypothetical protein
MAQERGPSSAETAPKRGASGRLVTIIIVLLAIAGAASSAYFTLQAVRQDAASNADGEPLAPLTEEQLKPSAEEVAFWEQIEARQPVFNEVERECLVDGTSFTLRTGDRKQDNAFGGVATDLMKIALAPPPKRPAAPRIDRQNFDQLLGTCPQCGATYFDIDLINIKSGRPPGAAGKLKSFDLGQAAPELAAKPQADWTYDERALARYLTQVAAGFPHEELGYTALSGAYNGNLSIGIGRKYSITPAAFYALAAAHFTQALHDKSYDNAQGGSLIAMTRGELYRLLGRREDAAASFKQATALGGLDERTAKIMAGLEKLNAEDDFTLQRQPLEGELRPPLGWYIDTILPNANAELQVARKQWGQLDDPAQIVAKIRQQVGP